VSEAKQLEQMLKEITVVETESNELDEEQKQLRLKAKLLAEKIIQELQKRNKAKLDVVNKLQSKISELESQLNMLSTPDVIDSADVSKDDSEEIPEGSELFVETLDQTGEDSVTVIEVEEEENNKHSKHERKKRGVF